MDVRYSRKPCGRVRRGPQNGAAGGGDSWVGTIVGSGIGPDCCRPITCQRVAMGRVRAAAGEVCGEAEPGT
jgi:hypothetical protein